MSSYPKYLNKVMLTKQKIADHEYTVLYDRQGNKYLKLETFDLSTTRKLDLGVTSSHPLLESHFTVNWRRTHGLN